MGVDNNSLFFTFVTHFVVVAVYVSVTVSVTCLVVVATSLVIVFLGTFLAPRTEVQKELTAALGKLFAIDWIRGLACGKWHESDAALSLKVGVPDTRERRSSRHAGTDMMDLILRVGIKVWKSDETQYHPLLSITA